MRLKSQNGFTLIELLVVLFIIGVLTALIFPNLMSARQRARDTQRKQDLEHIKNALRLYYNDNQFYPGNVPFGGSWPGYMARVPQDPVSGRFYRYCRSTDSEGFMLAANLENPGDPDISSSQSRCPTTICDPNCSPDPGNCFYVCSN